MQTNKGTSIKWMKKILNSMEDMNIGCSTNNIFHSQTLMGVAKVAST